MRVPKIVGLLVVWFSIYMSLTQVHRAFTIYAEYGGSSTEITIAMLYTFISGGCAVGFFNMLFTSKQN